MSTALTHKISTLVILQNSQKEFLLLKRAKSPNKGYWSPIGGKLDTAHGESPHQCAVRETLEETGFEIETSDLHLFAMAAEQAYEDKNHWLLFIFHCIKPIDFTPPAISEGHFDFFSRQEIDTLSIPKTDQKLLWEIFDEHRNGFVALSAACSPAHDLQIRLEESLPRH